MNGDIGFPEVTVYAENEAERDIVLACVREGHRTLDDVDVADCVTIVGDA